MVAVVVGYCLTVVVVDLVVKSSNFAWACQATSPCNYCWRRVRLRTGFAVADVVVGNDYCWMKTADPFVVVVVDVGVLVIVDDDVCPPRTTKIVDRSCRNDRWDGALHPPCHLVLLTVVDDCCQCYPWVGHHHHQQRRRYHLQLVICLVDQQMDEGLDAVVLSAWAAYRRAANVWLLVWKDSVSQFKKLTPRPIRIWTDDPECSVSHPLQAT